MLRSRDKAISRGLLITVYGGPGLTFILSILKVAGVLNFSWIVAFLPVVLIGSFLVIAFLAIATLILLGQLNESS